MDYGGQYCHLIARRIRELGVYTEIISPQSMVKDLEDYGQRYNLKGLILSGAPKSVHDEGALRLSSDLMDYLSVKQIPVLGICYGHQLIADYAGGVVKPGGKKEYGITEVSIDEPDLLLRGLSDRESVWMSHSDTVEQIPPDYELLAHTDNTPVVAFKHKLSHIYGLQFHPEVVHTPCGGKIFNNFVHVICGCTGNWRIADFMTESVKEIKNKIGDGKAVIALSGGVDSSTAALLTHRAIGEQLVSVFIDTGLMRKNEPEAVRETFEQQMHLNFRFVDARARFFKALRGVVDPEEKRKIIGNLFIRVFEEVANNINASYLVQGTIYPDRIESGLKDAATIKSHHNVGGLPDVSGLEIIEPLRNLYKDEVRVVARELGLPVEISERHPFPGPGLAIRVVGKVTEESVAVVREADAIVEEEILLAGLDKSLWQFFAVLLPVKSVGVQGDERTYSYTIALRMVESVDGMTANFAEVSYAVLGGIATRITNEIPQVNRVVYDLTHKPPGTIEWE